MNNMRQTRANFIGAKGLCIQKLLPSSQTIIITITGKGKTERWKTMIARN